MQVSDASLVMLPWPPLVLKSCGFVEAAQTILRSVPRIKCWNMRHWRAERLRCFRARTFSKANSQKFHLEDYNSYLKDWLPKIPRSERTGDCSVLFCHGPLTKSGVWVSRLLLNSSHDQVWKGRTSSNDPGLFSSVPSRDSLISRTWSYSSTYTVSLISHA
jgi:hypothetical protein